MANDKVMKAFLNTKEKEKITIDIMGLDIINLSAHFVIFSYLTNGIWDIVQFSYSQIEGYKSLSNLLTDKLEEKHEAKISFKFDPKRIKNFEKVINLFMEVR